MENNKGETEKRTKGYTEMPLSLKVAITAITAALYTALGYIFQPKIGRAHV